jgi:hypothetical protein
MEFDELRSRFYFVRLMFAEKMRRRKNNSRRDAAD